jgi:hypothetical protein
VGDTVRYGGGRCVMSVGGLERVWGVGFMIIYVVLWVIGVTLYSDMILG